MRALVVGDVIWDRDVIGSVTRIAPDAPVPVVEVHQRRDRPGGAGLAARLLARDGAEVRLAAPLAADAGGSRLHELVGADGVGWLVLADLPGTRRVTRVRSAGQSLVRVDECPPPLGADDRVDFAALDAGLEWAEVVVVADYGGGVTGHRLVRDRLARWARRGVLVWDPHPRGGPPVPGAAMVTPNRTEALRFASALAERPPGADRPTAAGTPGASGASGIAGADGRATGELDRAAEALRRHWRARSVAATDGAAGAYLATDGQPPLFVPVPFAAAVDPCGAGDRFAVRVAAGLLRGASPAGAVAVAVAEVAAWLRDGGVGEDGPVPPAAGRAGGTVVATGGCFDVLHAGHVASLQAARRLGDRLVVLLNSDDSVRRLKGPGRPVHTAADRARVLASLECVDEVRVFDGDTPEAALRELRPDVWAKGADYAAGRLPEADLVESWGGRVVLLPFLPGHSTTRILSLNRPDSREQSA